MKGFFRKLFLLLVLYSVMKAELQKLGHFYFTCDGQNTQAQTNRAVVTAELEACKKMESTHLRVPLML